MKKILTLLFLVSFLGASNAQLGKILKDVKKVITNEEDGEVGLGLKEALKFGVEEAVQKLSTENGYLESPYKILLPEEAIVVVNKLKKVPGFQDVEKNLVEKMNQAAEIAAKKATPIFVNAITSLTIKDAMNILLGEKDAATRYLDSNTRQPLYNEFLPVIQSALDEVNARTYWTTAVDAYNKIPFTKKVNPELDDHVNNKALDGLFSLIQVKEEKIRTNQSERKTDLLKNVFARQDK
jgi:hypothetical protein